MQEYTWTTFAIVLLASVGGFYLGVTTTFRGRGPKRLDSILLNYAKICGWIIGIGGLVAAIHLLLILLGYMSE